MFDKRLIVHFMKRQNAFIFDVKCWQLCIGISVEILAYYKARLKGICQT